MFIERRRREVERIGWHILIGRGGQFMRGTRSVWEIWDTFYPADVGGLGETGANSSGNCAVNAERAIT